MAGEEAEEKPAVQGVPGPCGVGGPLLVALRQERESESDRRPPPRGDGDREDARGVYVSLLGQTVQMGVRVIFIGHGELHNYLYASLSESLANYYYMQD